MNKRDLVEDMKKFSGTGFMNRKTFAKYMGYSDPHSIDSYLVGLERVNTNYFIGDLADSLLARKEMKA